MRLGKVQNFNFKNQENNGILFEEEEYFGKNTSLHGRLGRCLLRQPTGYCEPEEEGRANKAPKCVEDMQPPEDVQHFPLEEEQLDLDDHREDEHIA